MTFMSAIISWKTSWNMRANSHRRTKPQRPSAILNALFKLAGKCPWNQHSRLSGNCNSAYLPAKMRKRAWRLTWRSGRRRSKLNSMRGGRNKHWLATALVAAFILLILIPVPIEHEIAFAVRLYRNHLWLLVLLIAMLLGGLAWGLANSNAHEDRTQL